MQQATFCPMCNTGMRANPKKQRWECPRCGERLAYDLTNGDIQKKYFPTGRKRGNRGKCGVCGENGHNAATCRFRGTD